MKNFMRVCMTVVLFVCMACMVAPTSAAAKSKKVGLDLSKDYSTIKRPSALKKAKKVKVKSSKKSVVTVKYYKSHGDRRVRIVGKKKGKATITVKCYYKTKKTKTYKYSVTVKKSKVLSDKEKGKKAFELQNQYRKKNGVSQLEWSEELYEFAMYRLKTSGYDEHKYIVRDTADYFGDFARREVLMFGENMTVDVSAEKAIQSWKKSKGHRENMLNSSHLCGAIAVYKDIWIAVFWDKDKSGLENWKSNNIRKVNVKRFDTTTGSAITGSTIGYYEVDNRMGTLKSAKISKIEGENLYLDVGKTYVIYESIRPEGYEKAERVTITVTKDGPTEVNLYSAKSSS